jgi:hypothetical protein
MGGDRGTDAENGAAFDVSGTWKGTATDEDDTRDVVLVLSNNGGAYGTELAGTLNIEGIGELPFSDAFVGTTGEATRVFRIAASDPDGYSYELRGTFTFKRVDDGQLDSTNPELDVDAVFLDTVLVKED